VIDDGPDPKTIEGVRFVALSSPALSELLFEHLTENYGEVLPHVYMSDVRGFAEGEARIGNVGVVAEILDILEACLQRFGAPMEEVVAVSFLEAVDPAVSVEINSRHPALKLILDVMGQ
jgi:hypothetical protein